MMCSFINAILEYDPIGWPTLPYNHLFFGDIIEPLVKLCAQNLISLFAVRYPKLTPQSSFAR
jgi:High-temperature-induced dauer-formation protein